ncbi:Uncharacterised protein [Bacteroides pyogenes]|nr:Uncharacterised protein [Bacteroides pyogenes]
MRKDMKESQAGDCWDDSEKQTIYMTKNIKESQAIYSPVVAPARTNKVCEQEHLKKAPQMRKAQRTRFRREQGPTKRIYIKPRQEYPSTHSPAYMLR